MKKLLLLMFLVIAVFSISACSVFNGEKQQENGNKPQVIEEEDKEQNEKEDSDIKENSDIKEATGIYIGQIDSNAVEISIENEPKAFVITEVESEINKLEENENVKVKYIENEYGQLILKEIEKK